MEQTHPAPPRCEAVSLRAGADLMAAVRAAAARGCGWLVVAAGAVAPEQRDRLLAAALLQPGALLLARSARPRAGAWLRRLRFRLQTGLRLSDPAAGPWLLPTIPVAPLRLIARRGGLQVEELLVRAAWAGLPLIEVDLTPVAAVSQAPEPWSIGQRFFAGWLRLHLVFRALLPRRGLQAAQRGAEGLSLRRPLQSLRRLLAENHSPSQLAATGALGVLLGTLPLLGVQSITVLMSAGFLRLNRWVALATNQLCMPPLVPALCIETGHFLRHGRWLTEISVDTLGYQAPQRLWEWLLGSLLLAPVLALTAAAVIWPLAALMRRRLRLARRGRTES
jgi:uncharacterized protein (DUF2062 family)